ncbi:MAG TPA: hypothetical protein VGP76_31370 [Planctomycetaceae bacterium]|jgi:hypothetical protein|nr:hypothetical protein [Planctomycetaceae bacterium]
MADRWSTAGLEDARGRARLCEPGDRIFTLGDKPSGAKDKDEYIVCFDRETGKRLWSKKASPKSYSEVGSFEVPGSGERPSWSHPVILDGKLYLREQDQVRCYDIRANGTGSPLAGR